MSENAPTDYADIGPTYRNIHDQAVNRGSDVSCTQSQNQELVTGKQNNTYPIIDDLVANTDHGT